MENPSPPTVFIPSLNGGQKLIACLESLSDQTADFETVIADNGLPGSELNHLADRFPEVEVLSFGENLGFGKALNRAVAGFGSGPLIFLNDDTVAQPDFVEKMVSANEDAPMVAGVLTRPEAPGLIDSAGVIVDQTLMAFDFMSGRRVEDLDPEASPLGPTGGAALFDRELFLSVGGFDERMFLYYEDVDLAIRMRAIGARCALAAGARAEHAYSATLGAKSSEKSRMTGWSRGYLLRRYRIIHGVSSFAEVMLREIPICVAQLISRRTTAGIAGRLDGYRAAAGLDARTLPPDSTIEMSARAALTLRTSRAG